MKRITRQVAFSGLSKEESYRFALQLIAKARSENESIRIGIVTGKAAPPDPALVLDMPGGSSAIRIPYRRIISISSDRHYICIRCTGGIQRKFRFAFRSVTAQIFSGKCPVSDSAGMSDNLSVNRSADDPADRFLLVNRGVLVNMDHIRSVEKRIITMQDGSRCTIHSRYHKKITEQYEMYLLRK